jgi:chromosomal replication initiation ATPase DnaA
MKGLQITRRCFKNLQSISNNSPITQNFIFFEVCKKYGLMPDYVLSQNKIKTGDICEIRQVTMYLTRFKTGLSQRVVGSFFGKDHATCLHSENTIKNLLSTNRDFKEKMGEFIGKLKSL